MRQATHIEQEDAQVGPAEAAAAGGHVNHIPEDQASRAGTSSLDHWEAQSLEALKTGGGGGGALPAFEEDDDRGLSKAFRISIMVASVLMMIGVVLCLVVVLPRSAKAGSHHHDGKSELYLRQPQPPDVIPSYPDVNDDLQLIATACQGTSYPDVCQASLATDMASREATTPGDLVQAAIGVAYAGGLPVHASAADLLRDTKPAGNPNLTDAAAICEYLLGRASAFCQRSLQAYRLGTRAAVEDVQAWMSAALTYENDCRSALSYVDVAPAVGELMGEVGHVIALTSNALSMAGARRLYGDDVGAWRPPTRETVYGGSTAAGTAPSGDGDGGWWWQRPPSVTVAQDGRGEFESVQAAVDAAPEGLGGADDWFIIYVRRGTYHETVRVPSSKRKLALVGDGMGQSVVTGQMNAQMPGVTTYDSATVAIDGDYFVAVGMTFENTAGPERHQAVALRVDSDFSAFYNCSFLGHQDTLYAHSLRQFYRSCRVEGTIDFIFGNAAAVFQDCAVMYRPGRAGVGTAVATAQGRTDPAETTGLVFQGCEVNGTEAYWGARLARLPDKRAAYLGRPWKAYSRTVFLQSELAAVVRPEGWLPWNGSFALATLFYGEYRDSGPGSLPTRRVPWASQLSLSQAAFFTLSPAIQADRWLPSTHIPFTPSLDA